MHQILHLKRKCRYAFDVMLKIQLPYSRTKLKLSIKTFNRHLLSYHQKVENNFYRHLKIKTKIYL